MSAAAKPDWLLKSLAGTVLGFTLAICLAGAFSHLTPYAPSKYQMVMWLVAPVWLGTLSAVYLFRSGRAAWIWLGAANAVAYALMLLSRSLFG